MKRLVAKRISFLLALTALSATTHAVSAQAQTSHSLELDLEQPDAVEIPVSDTDSILSNIPLTSTPENEVDLDETTQFQLAEEEALDVDVITLEKASTGEPVPGTTATSVDALLESPETAALPQQENVETDDSVAQIDIDPGRATRSGRSYVGVGFNVGIGGDTTLGDGSFAINGKIGLTPTLSVRPAALLGDDTVFLIPLTYDFSPRREDPFEEVRFAPFVGGGVLFTTDEDDNIGFLLTGGVDVPISREFVANAALNVGFKDETEVGILLGVGYTFPGF